MLPHIVKDSNSFHNLARELSSSTPSHKLNKANGFIKKYTKPKDPNNFSEHASKVDADHPSKSKKPSSKSGKDGSRNDRTSAITAVPDPVPDTEVNYTSAHSDPQVIYRTTVLPLVDAPTGLAPAAIAATAPPVAQATWLSASLGPLPSLQLASPPGASSSISTPYPAGSAPSTSFASAARVVPSASYSTAQHVEEAGHSKGGVSHHLPVVVITLLAVGAAFVLLGVFIIIRACSRPQKRKHPKPSLPILQDTYSDQYASDGSPIFGGKERFSEVKDESSNPDAADSGLWRWTQYTHPVLSKPAAIANPEKGNVPNEWAGETYHQNSAGDRLDRKKQGQPNHKAPASQVPPLQQVQSALTRGVSRLSAASMSLYPGSPLNGDVGLAIDGATSFTADGLPLINKRAMKDKVVPSRSRSSTLSGHEKIRDTTCTRYSDGFPYDGADVTSPVQFQTATHVKLPALASNPNLPASGGGRARIKSTYFAPGAYPRISTVAPLPSSKTLTSSLSTKDVRTGMQKSESRRGRETQALTSALGLMSPEMQASPQLTIYPDDSRSIAGAEFVRARKNSSSGRNLSQKKSAPRYLAQQQQPGIVSPNPEPSASLGSLMLIDYATPSTSKLVVGEDPASGDKGDFLKLDIKRADDKPPRVPSPPALPSLTQMGLQHANPEAYADYRSPTYSIYGLYEADRKSRTTSSGY